MDARPLAGSLATRFVLLKAFDPEFKGIVERANGYLETLFMHGRTFASPAEFNSQLTDWLTVANARHVRRINTRTVDAIQVDRVAMTPLPPIPPQIGIRERVRLGREH